MEETQSLDTLLSEGERLLAEGDKIQALDHFKQATLIDVRSERAWLGVAKATDDVDEAIQALGQVITLNPGNVEARNLRLSLQVGNLREGINANEQAYRKNSPPRLLIPVLLALDILVYALLALVGWNRLLDWLR
jgi:tetratricopeptide (TPR) repeat protein